MEKILIYISFISFLLNILGFFAYAPKILSKLDFKMSRVSRRKNQVIRDLNKYLQYHGQNVEILDVYPNFPKIKLN